MRNLLAERRDPAAKLLHVTGNFLRRFHACSQTWLLEKTFDQLLRWAFCREVVTLTSRLRKATAWQAILSLSQGEEDAKRQVRMRISFGGYPCAGAESK
jgi:hypothetical protein